CRGHVERRAFKEWRHELASDLEGKRKRDNEKNQIDEQGGLAKPETQLKDRQIDGLSHSGDGVSSFGSQFSANKKKHQHGHKRNRQQGGKTDRQSFRPS